MFVITGHRGFHLKFANGYAVSVQFGPMNYCSHYGSRDFFGPERASMWESETAEVAIFGPDGQFVRPPGIADNWDDDVNGHQSADDVAALITAVAALHTPPTITIEPEVKQLPPHE